jgi:hypothetical protein
MTVMCPVRERGVEPMTSTNSTGVRLVVTDQKRPDLGDEPPRIPAALPTAPLDAGHRPSHEDLVGRVPQYFSGPRTPLSGVIVPTRRGAGVGSGLGLAAQCAGATDAQLVVIRSGDASAHPFPRYLVPQTSCPPIVIDLPERLPDLFPTCRTRHRIVDTLHRGGDLGFKRNLALLLAMMCGWETAFMIDDDISATRASEGLVRPVAEPLLARLRLDDVLADFANCPELRAAGYVVEDFDDNSVVCHTRKLLGRPQSSFIGGGALLIRPERDLPFFAGTYNEDWLFLFWLMLQGRSIRPSSAVKLVGPIHQQAYHPFSASRARAEELGDILAEGLFCLLGLPRAEVLRHATSPDYWELTIWRRQNMVLSLMTEIRDRNPFPVKGSLTDVDEALRASLGVIDSRRESAEELAAYLSDSLDDLDDWHELVAKISPSTGGDVLGIEEAVSTAGLMPFASFVKAA